MMSENYNPIFNILHQIPSISNNNNNDNKNNNKKTTNKKRISIPKPKIPKKVLGRMRTYTDTDLQPVIVQPPLPERKKHHFIAISIGGSLLTLNAGFINAVTALHSGIFTTHVSGTFTRTGIDIEQLNGNSFLLHSMLILCFITGSFLCSLLVPYQTFYLGRAYNLVFILGTFLLTIAAILGILLPDNPTYTFFVTTACGMQNAMTTGYSGSVLRTTHMTGMSTDVGIILGKLAKGDRKDLWKLAMFLPMMFSFLIGGTIGSKAVTDLGPYALIMNIVLFAGTGTFYVTYISFKHHISFFTALFHGKDLKPLEKHGFIPKEENVDEVIAAERQQNALRELTGNFGDGFDNDSEVDETELSIREEDNEDNGDEDDGDVDLEEGGDNQDEEEEEEENNDNDENDNSETKHEKYEVIKNHNDEEDQENNQTNGNNDENNNSLYHRV